LKIADFGMARHADLTLTVTNAPGTTPYTAPEVFINCRAHHTSRDVYSFGIVLWEMASRQKPYDGLEHAHIMFNVCGEKQLRPSQTQQNVPAGLWMLIRRSVCINID
jgi:serine/threonine protein kinase